MHTEFIEVLMETLVNLSVKTRNKLDGSLAFDQASEVAYSYMKLFILGDKIRRNHHDQLEDESDLPRVAGHQGLWQRPTATPGVARAS